MSMREWTLNLGLFTVRLAVGHDLPDDEEPKDERCDVLDEDEEQAVVRAVASALENGSSRRLIEAVRGAMK